MMKFLVYLEQTDFSQWVRDAPTVWGIPDNSLPSHPGNGNHGRRQHHAQPDGAGLLACCSDETLRAGVPTIVLGLRLKRSDRNHDAGCRPTTKLRTPDFYVKMALVFAGLFVLIRMRRQIFQNPQLDKVPMSGNAKMLAWASMACWFGAITAGRLLAYVGPAAAKASGK